MNSINNWENTPHKTSGVIFDQTSFWLIIGVIVIFIAGTVFGRLTYTGTTASTNSNSSQHVAHHSVYGRYGQLRWAQ
jgi:hypothetical protein